AQDVPRQVPARLGLARRQGARNLCHGLQRSKIAGRGKIGGACRVGAARSRRLRLDGIMNAPDDPNADLKGDAKIVAEARERLKRALDKESYARGNMRDDRIFANADARNHAQWPDAIYNRRVAPDSNKPALTINKTRVHNRICINEAMQSKASIKI